MKKVLMVGGGAREHAMVKALKRDEIQLYTAMKNMNPGIADASEEVFQISEMETENIADWAAEKGIDFAVVGPEAPLGAGIVDALAEKGIPSASPSKAAAQIEISKVYMRDLMQKYDLPGKADYKVLSDLDEISAFLDTYGKEVVIKPVGLTGGKGVKVQGEHMLNKDEVMEYCREIIENEVGGSAAVVIEERLVGEEFTLQCFSDGTNVKPLPPVQDHKRAYEGDVGPNTGGMGSYSMEDHLLPFLKPEEYAEGVEIVRRIIKAMKEDGAEYKGVIYGQFMLTVNGPKIIEINARFGDPEAMNVLPLLESSYVQACEAMINGTLDQVELKFKKQATVCKYIVPEGYGKMSVSNQEVTIDHEKLNSSGAEIFYAAVNAVDGKIFTTSSRSIGVVGTGDSIEIAEQMSEAALSAFGGRIFMRHDIGKKESLDRKLRHMNEVRGMTRLGKS